MFVYMKDYNTNNNILINRNSIIKVSSGYNFVKLYYNDTGYFKVKHSLKEAKRILNVKQTN